MPAPSPRKRSAVAGTEAKNASHASVPNAATEATASSDTVADAVAEDVRERAGCVAVSMLGACPETAGERVDQPPDGSLPAPPPMGRSAGPRRTRYCRAKPSSDSNSNSGSAGIPPWASGMSPFSSST